MEQQRNQEIREMAKVLGPEYMKYAFESLISANKKLDTFASLLIAIAFSSIGLSVQLLNNGGFNDSLIRTGIFVLALSIIFGLDQLYVDHLFFLKKHELYSKIGSKFGAIGCANEVTNTDVEEGLECLQLHSRQKNSSNLWPLATEICLVMLGGILILSRLLF